MKILTNWQEKTGLRLLLLTCFVLANSFYLQADPSSIQDLNWLAGKWEDKDENVTVAIQWNWDKNKKFLKQQFDIEVKNQPALSGTQIIGWDPIEKKIRSWIFDTDGGFGEGFWNKSGDTWYNQIVYTTPSGFKASAVNTYKKVEDNVYLFGSINREIAGEMLPNMDSVKIVKIAGEK